MIIMSASLTRSAGGILILKTYRVTCVTPVRINGNLVGNLPGTGETAWTPDVRILVTRSFLQVGPNQLQIGPAVQIRAAIQTDFMFKDTRLEIDLE